MFLNKIIMVLNHFNRFGLKGVKFLFTHLYGRQGLIKLDFPQFKHPIYLRNKTSDIPTFYQCIFEEQYDINVDFEPKIIVDLGSNIGLSAVYFKSRYPEATIICVEPDKSNFELLIKNTENFENIHCFQNGVWHKEVNLKIENSSGPNWSFTVVETTDGTGMKAITIDKIMESIAIETIDILKMDIEGSEKEVFSYNAESWLPKVKVIIIELHDKSKAGCSKSFFDALKNYDFAIRQKGENLICYMNMLKRPKTKKTPVF